MSNTVSLCMICKNEIHNIESLIRSVCPVIEQVVVVDTGSTDGTLEILRSLAQEYRNLQIEKFEWVKDFSAARNYSFSFARNEWVFWLDCDDQIDPVELKKFKDNELLRTDVDCWVLDYVYSRLPNGDPYTILGRERFVRRSLNPRWHGAIHETIGIWNMRQRHYSGLQVLHERTGKAYDINRNVDILESEYRKNPNDPRTAYYLGKELFDRIDPRGLEVLKRYLTLEGRYWDDEINARFRLACDDLVNGRLTEAVNHAEKIYHLDHTRLRAECYWIYGNVEQRLRNFRVAIRWYERCLDGEPPSPRVLNREYYSWNPMFRIAECYRDLGDVPKAIVWYNKVSGIIPSDNPMNRELEKSILKIVRQPQGLRIAELTDGEPVRNDSQVFPAGFDFGGFGKESFKGIVTDVCGDILPLEQGGFLWTRVPYTGIGVGSLGTAIFNGVKFYNYVKEFSVKPSFYIPDGDIEFGPYRLRLFNLKCSLVKNGYPLREKADYVVSQDLNRDHSRGKIKILDVCEWLPDSSYNNFGVKHADIICCSSKLLAEKMAIKFPDKSVVAVEDHVDFTEQEWL